MSTTSDSLAKVSINPSAGSPPVTAPSLLRIFWIFLRLGCTSFGGPAAHIGFFHAEFVERRGWLSSKSYADLVALCHFLPGPSSSQVGMGIGALLQGTRGAVAAWLGFTFPSLLLMLGFALGLAKFEGAWVSSAISGLQLAVLLVLAQAVLEMGRKLCPDGTRRVLVLITAALVLVLPGALSQLLIMVGAACFGVCWFANKILPTAPVPPIHLHPSPWQQGATWLLLFAVCLATAFSSEWFTSQWQYLAAAAYQAGSLVFGGGHVVLPLLQELVVAPGWLDRETFYAGYGAAQALPGPLFSFAAFVGAASAPAAPLFTGIVCTLAIFLPGLLLLLGVLPFWPRLRQLKRVQAALMAVNAAVVGLLLAALVQAGLSYLSVPSGWDTWREWGLLAAGALALWVVRVPSWALVIGMAGANVALAALA